MSEHVSHKESLEQSGSMISEFAVTSEEFMDLGLLKNQME